MIVATGRVLGLRRLQTGCYVFSQGFVKRPHMNTIYQGMMDLDSNGYGPVGSLAIQLSPGYSRDTVARSAIGAGQGCKVQPGQTAQKNPFISVVDVLP